MSGLRVGLPAAGLGALLAVLALGIVHHELLVGPALAVGLLAAAATQLLRGTWSHLPLYIGAWLDLGVVVSVSLLAAVGHALADGLAFTVLRASELAMLTAASLLVALATTGLAYTHLRLAREIEDQQQQTAELQRAALQSRLAALSAQIHPHFLFNTLNTLAELVHEDEDAAEDLVTDLSAMMRTALRSSTGLVPLADELDVVRRLLRIESARLGDRLEWSIENNLPDGIEVEVPGLSIQPLVENAVKYAAAARTQGGRVVVGVSLVDEAVQVRVHDNGPGLPDAIARAIATGVQVPTHTGTEGHGGGLWNCRERLRLTWPDRPTALRHLPEETGTCLLLRLPQVQRSP